MARAGRLGTFSPPEAGPSTFPVNRDPSTPIGTAHRPAHRVAFVFNQPFRLPRNNREYYAAKELLRRGFDVRWFCRQAGDYPFETPLPRHALSPKPKSKLCRAFYSLYLATVLKKHKVDLLWLSGWNERSPLQLLLLTLSLKVLRIRTLYDTVDPVYEYALTLNPHMSSLKKRGMRLAMKGVYALATTTLAVTDTMRDALVSHGAPAHRVRVAGWGPDISVFNPKRNFEDLKSRHGVRDKFVIGWLGHMSRLRGIDDILIPLIRDLPERMHDAFFFVAGGGFLEHRFEALSRDSRLPLRLFGRIPYVEAPAFTASLDLYVVPLNTASFLANVIQPVKLFDALAMGIPVVATKTPATQRLAETFTSLQLAAPGYEPFLDAVLTVRQSYTEKKQLAEQEASKVKAYSLQTVSAHVAGMVEDIL